jgi:hypothetical protein
MRWRSVIGDWRAWKEAFLLNLALWRLKGGVGEFDLIYLSVVKKK